MKYVDGYVLPVPKKKLKAYARIAQKAGKVWREHGALDYKECAEAEKGVGSHFSSMQTRPRSPEAGGRKGDRLLY